MCLPCDASEVAKIGRHNSYGILSRCVRYRGRLVGLLKVSSLLLYCPVGVPFQFIFRRESGIQEHSVRFFCFFAEVVSLQELCYFLLADHRE